MTYRLTQNNISVGLDIGTSTISTIVLDCTSGKVLHSCTVPNAGGIQSSNTWEHTQSAAWIWETSKNLLDTILEDYTVFSIGVTGQMHGILYTSPDGVPLSPLYTWQDCRANQGQNSACEIIKKKTGYTVPTGYGLATHYHLLRENQTPAETYYCSTIMDYITMKLCGLSHPITHITNAASWGFYKDDKQGFDTEALGKLGIDCAVLPKVVVKNYILGTYNGIPVSVAIGDNQAAFIGSVKDPEHTVLVNIGTGSQISLLADKPLSNGFSLVESRPFDGERYLLSGAGLCGGRAYALLENFFKQYAVALGFPDKPQYDILNELAARGIKKGTILPVRTTFCGTRKDPDLRGQITDIGEDNLTPEALMAGVLYGIVNELLDMYKMVPTDSVQMLVASGNAVRKNTILQQILTDTFHLPLQIPLNNEEAACGAAIYGNNAARNKNLSDIQKEVFLS